MNSLVPLDIDRIRINLLKTKSPQTVKHVMGILKRINNFAISKGLAPGLNFFIQAPRVDNIKTEDLNAGQLASLFEAIRASSHVTAGAMMQCALFTGMRRGEMFKLRWPDIDFERGFITLRDPKGGTSQKIPLNESARGLFASLPRSSEFVFPGRGGRQRVDINKQLNEIKTAAGLPKDFRPLHGLRHTYASMLASSGQVDMFVLQKLLTHKTPAMTQRYAHLRDDALKRAAGLAGEIITSALDQDDQGKGKPGKNNITNG
ncbi:MAG: tyrosine-type recombinase/integrase [Desulfobulbaceae bacterium]